MTPSARWLDLQLGVNLAIAAALLPVGFLLTEPYHLNIVIMTVLFAVMGLGWVIAAGLTGVLLIGYISFFGVGAYASALLFTKAGVSPWLGFIAAGALGGALAWAVARLTLRFGLREDYFGLFTVALSQILLVIFFNWDFAGRATGVYITVVEDDPMAMAFVDRGPYLLIVLGLFVGVSVLAHRLMRGRFGLLLTAVRNNPSSAEALGVDASAVRVKAIAIGGAVAGVCGAFYAQFTTFIDPRQVFGLGLNFDFLLVPVLGGRFSLIGPVIGAVALRPTKDILRALFGGVADAVFLVVYGLLLVVFMLLLPRGAAGFIEDRWRAAREKEPT